MEMLSGNIAALRECFFVRKNALHFQALPFFAVRNVIRPTFAKKFAS